MKSRRILPYFAIFLIIIYLAVESPSAIQAVDEDIPSDLSLDLQFAQQNPAPAQKQIVQSQTPQAQITTSSGDHTSITVKDVVPEEAKVESPKNANNPDQTTSEQVVNKTVVEIPSPSGTTTSDENQQPTATPNASPVGADQKVIPGTTIVEPDDNAALAEPASSANPSLNSPESSPVPTSSDNPSPTNNPNPANSPQPSSNSDTQNTQSSEPKSNTIPLENGATPASTPTTDNSNSSPNNPQPPSNPPSSDNSNSGNSSDQSGAGNSSGSGDGSSGDSSAVQGVSIGPNIPFWQQFISDLTKIFRK